MSFFLVYAQRLVELSTLLKYPDMNINMGIKNELYGMKSPKRFIAVNVWESTTMKIPIADKTINFLLDLLLSSAINRGSLSDNAQA